MILRGIQEGNWIKFERRSQPDILEVKPIGRYHFLPPLNLVGQSLSSIIHKLQYCSNSLRGRKHIKNNLQRHTIQNMSCDVAGMERGLSALCTATSTSFLHTVLRKTPTYSSLPMWCLDPTAPPRPPPPRPYCSLGGPTEAGRAKPPLLPAFIKKFRRSHTN